MEIGTENKTDSLDDLFADLDSNPKTETPKTAEPSQEAQSDRELAENVVKVVEKNIEPSKQDMIIDFAVRYLELQRQKKVIDVDIKALKQEYAEQGIAYQNTLKALTSLQKHKKMSDNVRFEVEAIESTLEQSKKVQDALESLSKVE